jgi:hypothetical protein
MSMLSLVSVLTTLFLVAVPLVAAILVALATRGQTRILGATGFGIFALEGLLGGAWVLLAPRLIRDTDLSVALVSGVYSGVRSLLAVLGLVLLAVALINGANRRPDPAGYPGMR